jgi:hypothetical protein
MLFQLVSHSLDNASQSWLGKWLNHFLLDAGPQVSALLLKIGMVALAQSLTGGTMLGQGLT